MHEIFVSHCGEDKEISKMIYENIKDVLNISLDDFFFSSDKGIIPCGHDWGNYLKRKIRNSKCYLIFATPNYFNSMNCMLELGYLLYGMEREEYTEKVKFVTLHPLKEDHVQNFPVKFQVNSGCDIDVIKKVIYKNTIIGLQELLGIEKLKYSGEDLIIQANKFCEKLVVKLNEIDDSEESEMVGNEANNNYGNGYDKSENIQQIFQKESEMNNDRLMNIDYRKDLVVENKKLEIMIEDFGGDL